MSRWLASLSLLLLAMPGIAEACAVCMGGQEDASRVAFVVTTALLTLLPLGLLGGALLFLRRRFRALSLSESGDLQSG